MSGLTENDLASKLQQLKCHFTWSLLKKDVDIDALEERLHSQLQFPVTKFKYLMYNLLAYVIHLKGDLTNAISNLKKAEENIKEKNPDGIDRKYLVTFGDYAWMYYQLKQYEDSQNYIDKIDKINKGLKLLSNESQDIAEIYGEQGWSLLTFSGKYCKKAKECFAKALEVDPENPEWNSGYATAVYRWEGYYGAICSASECKSLPLLKRAIELNPNDAVVKALLALKLQDLDRADEGRNYVEEALEQAPDSPYLLRYVAMFYRKAGLVDEALRVLKTALDLTPKSSFIHHQMGLCYKQKILDKKEIFRRENIQNRQMCMGETEIMKTAILHFQKAVEYKKTFIFAYIQLAKMYSIATEYRRADDTYKKVLTFPNLTDEEKQQIHFSYGRFEQCNKKSESEAIKHYKKGFQINEKNRYRDGCETGLRRMAELKFQRDPSDALGFGLLGFVYKNNGKTSKAIEYYENALQYDPNNEEYLTDLCDLKKMI